MSWFAPVPALILFILLPLQAAHAESRSRAPFARAIVLSGENINTPFFIGILEGAEDAGYKPDVIVASCGGSIAAAIAHLYPSKAERRKFIRSREFHAVIRNLELNNISLFEFIQRVSEIKRQSDHNRALLTGAGCDPETNEQRIIPQLDGFALIKTPGDVDIPQLRHPFSSQGTRVVILGSRAEFDVSSRRTRYPAAQKLYTEVYFTDPDTARYLKDMPSLVGSRFPGSALNRGTQVITDATLAQAVRASVADPFLMYPAKIKDERYLGGVVNIDPNNVARRLAQDVTARYPGKYGPVENTTLMAAFGFDANEVRRIVIRNGAEHWIDGTQRDEDASGRKVPSLSPGARYHRSSNLAQLIQFDGKVPERYEDYVKIADAQMRVGYERAVEAYEQPRNSTAHIREKKLSEPDPPSIEPLLLP